MVAKIKSEDNVGIVLNQRNSRQGSPPIQQIKTVQKFKRNRALTSQKQAQIR